jgi:hypothetical protein
MLVEYRANGNDQSPLVEVEMQEILAALEYGRQVEVKSWAQAVKSRSNRKRFIICIAVAILSLWNGQGVISYSFSPLLKSTGITSTEQQTGINGGMAIWNFLCSLAGAMLADRIERRTLWLASFIGMIFANVPLTIARTMYAKHRSQASAYAIVAFLFMYNAAFNIACNPLLYCYTTEILSYSIRTRGLALQILVSQVTFDPEHNIYLLHVPRDKRIFFGRGWLVF